MFLITFLLCFFSPFFVTSFVFSLSYSFVLSPKILLSFVLSFSFFLIRYILYSFFSSISSFPSNSAFIPFLVFSFVLLVLFPSPFFSLFLLSLCFITCDLSFFHLPFFLLSISFFFHLFFSPPHCAFLALLHQTACISLYKMVSAVIPLFVSFSLS